MSQHVAPANAPTTAAAGRRAALLGAAGLLAGCGTYDLAFDGRRYAATGDAPLRPPAPGTRVAPIPLRCDDGAPCDAGKLQGRWSLVYFGYTACADACPTGLAAIAHMLDSLGPDAARMLPLFVSFDPARDGPEALRLYLRQFHPALVGLTGTQAEVDAVARRFGARAWRVPMSDPGNYKLDHTSLVYLVDPAGHLSANLWPQQAPEEWAAVAQQRFAAAARPA